VTSGGALHGRRAAERAPGVVSLGGAAVAAGLASQFSFGGSGSAWAPALAESLRVGSAGDSTSVSIQLQHARPTLADSTTLFPETTATTAASGFRDELALGLALDLAFDVDSHIPRHDPVVELHPAMGFVGGVLFTDTQLVLPAFAGPTAYRGRMVSPELGFGLALEARIRDWIVLVPRVDALVTLGRDEREIEGGGAWNLEWRLSPGAHLVVLY
jgi:hypothetical protein